MLDIEQAIIASLQPALFGEPGLRARIGRIDADVHHLRYIHAPIAHDSESILIPVRVGDDIDCHIDAQRAGELQRLEVAPKRDAFAELAQAILIECLNADKDVRESDLLPELEDILASKQHVAAGVQPEVLTDSLVADRSAHG